MCRKIYGVISFICCLVLVQAGIQTVAFDGEDLYEERLANDLLTYVETGNQSAFLQNNFDKIQFPFEGRQLNIYELKRSRQNLACTACRLAFRVVLSVIKPRMEDPIEVSEKLINICGILGFGEAVVCRKMIQFNLGAVLYITRNSKGLTADYICGSVFQGTCVSSDQSREWSVEIDNKGPPIKGHKNNIPSTEHKLTIAHITDTHYDPKYQEGANAVCNYPMCCRSDMGIPSTPRHGAGKWGDYRHCDMPWESIQNVFDQIEEHHKNIDVVYMTGDFIDHATWDTSVESNQANIKKTSEAMRAAFPDVLLFPSIGNHEPHPLNLFSPDDIDDPNLKTTPVYEFLADTWYWLPESAKETLRIGGYYTAIVRPGLRVISLNNNLCNTYNFWNLYDTKYMADHLQWLHDILLDAEQEGDKVHILGHMGSGEGDCINTWGREYRRVVDRFWNTISGQFIGHTHKDEFNIHYSREHPDHAINVVWNGGCATTYSWVNPNYRLYSVESETFQVTDHETWIYNLTEANEPNNRPRWFKEYTFKEAYNLSDLSPASLDQLVKRFSRDDQLLYSYWEHYVKMGDPYIDRGCDSKCLADVLCKIVTTEYYDRSKCDELLARFWQGYDDVNEDL